MKTSSLNLLHNKVALSIEAITIILATMAIYFQDVVIVANEAIRNNQQELSTMDQLIIDVVKNESPSTVEQLIKLVQLRQPAATEEEILKCILRLESQGKLVFKEGHPPSLPLTLIRYLLSTQAYWYWATIILAIATTTLVFTIPENAYPIVYARYALGSLFVLWLPGYSLIKALFPTKELDNIERTALSIGMSLALVPIAGLLLNYTPWGIRTTPITLSLLALTTALATAAIIREHQALR